jgi:hypothetical protein
MANAILVTIEKESINGLAASVKNYNVTLYFIKKLNLGEEVMS